MKYEFPHITHLDQVRPAIEGRDEFIIAERDWGYVVNYMVSMTDTFPPVETEMDAIRRECRGMLFHKDGSIMARRLHKFFNIGERDETQFGVIDFTQPHVILEKLDGSMITPVVMSRVPDERFPKIGDDEQIMRVGDIRWGTKMGITEVSMQAEEFVAKHPQYEQFARWCMDYTGYTPIFEWCSRKQRIVVDYPEDRLVLIAARATESGKYASLQWLQEYGDMFDIEVVQTYQGSAQSMAHLMDETKDAEGIEGYIIRFDDGHMVKCKGEWYLRIHKTKDHLLHEKNIIELLIEEKMDDAKAFMLDDDRKRVEDFETDFWIGVNQTVKSYDHYFDTVVAHGLDRKRYALEWMPTIKAQDQFAPGIVFGKFDGKDTRKMVMDLIRKHLGSQTKVDEARSLWGSFRWTYHFEADA
jgi:RNA ligase